MARPVSWHHQPEFIEVEIFAARLDGGFDGGLADASLFEGLDGFVGEDGRERGVAARDELYDGGFTVVSRFEEEGDDAGWRL
jgi:hypothetical protein